MGEYRVLLVGLRGNLKKTVKPELSCACLSLLVFWHNASSTANERAHAA